MATFVIVHGAWGGGWEWSGVAQLLRARGHFVWTPTLTGLGERSHLAMDARIGLDTHITDVAEMLEFEDLHDVVLCVASFAGMVAPGVAEQAAGRVASVVYVDALIPAAGTPALDLLPSDFGDLVRSGLRERGDHWRIPLPSNLLAELVPADADRYVRRLRDHPAATFVDPVGSTAALDALPRGFVRCTRSGLTDDPIAACAARARADGWIYRELDAPHDPQLYAPEQTAEVLAELGSRFG